MQVESGIYRGCSTLVSAGKKRRLTLIECGNDLNTMMDVAKIADLVSAFITLISIIKWNAKQAKVV